MSADLNKIVDFFVAQVSTAGNLIRMEKKRLQILFEKSSHSVKNYIENWLTCSNYIKFKEKISWNITSVWCVALWKVNFKNFTWNHTKKETVNRQVNAIKAIINHLWWCCTSSVGNEELIWEKRISILNHIWGIHSWVDDKLFHKCEHRLLAQEWKWLKTNSSSFLAFKKFGRK